jgi:hypothetical protein
MDEENICAAADADDAWTEEEEQEWIKTSDALVARALRQKEIATFVKAKEAQLDSLKGSTRKGRPTKEISNQKAALHRAINLARDQNILPTDEQQLQEESKEEKEKRIQEEKEKLIESATGVHIRHHAGPGEAKRGCSGGTSRGPKDPMSIGHHRRPVTAAQLRFNKEIRDKAMSNTTVRWYARP